MTTYAQPAEVHDRLRDLGLTPDVLESAVLAGELERVSCTPLDPLSFPGLVAWGYRVRRLREQLITEGWRYSNPANLPLVIEPQRGIAIATTAGNEHTGTDTAPLIPTTKYPKGPMMAVQVRQNQAALFRGEPRWMPTPDTESLVTWLLLVYTEFRPINDETGSHQARVELSLPSEIDEEGFVTAWRERILIPTVTLDNIPAVPGLDDSDLDFDVPVTRRTSE